MRRFLLFAAVCFVAVVPAMADPPSLTFNDVVGSQTIRMHDSEFSENYYVYVGVCDITVTGVGSGVDSGRMASFCVDVGDSVRFNETYAVNVTPLNQCPDSLPVSDFAPMGDVKASQVAWLLDNSFNGTGYSLGMGAVNGAGLQLAIWEVIREGKTNPDGSYAYNVSDGDFYAWANDSVKDVAKDLLGDLAAGWSSGYSFAGYAGLSNPCRQDFVVKVVPLPGAVLLGVLGLGAAGIKLHRMVG